jgi:DNA polymerase (family 10)
MTQAAKARGYAYMALTDHSRRVTIAHGLDRARLLRQIDEIDRLNAKLRGFTVLKGIEVDILADGSLDLPDEVLSRLDFVVAAVHYKFDLSRDEQTERIIRAMDNRHVSILAHPTGRLIEERAHDIDMGSRDDGGQGTRLPPELNAEPRSLDLTDVAAKAAKELAQIAISTDAHSTAGLAYMRYGVDQARRGWLSLGCYKHAAATIPQEIDQAIAAALWRIAARHSHRPWVLAHQRAVA